MNICNTVNLVSHRAGMKSAAVLLPLLGVSWAFGLLTINKKTIAFQYIFAISNSFQVIIIFRRDLYETMFFMLIDHSLFFFGVKELQCALRFFFLKIITTLIISTLTSSLRDGPLLFERAWGLGN